MEFKHVSVLLEETIDSLNICPDGIYVAVSYTHLTLPTNREV